MNTVKGCSLIPMLTAGLMFIGIPSALADLSDGLVAHWPFDEEDPVGEAPEIVNGNNGVLMGGASLPGGAGIAPIFGNDGDLELDGASGYLSVSHSDALDMVDEYSVSV